MRYSVWEGNMESLMKKVIRIQNKCRKYGCDFHFEEVGEEFKHVNENDEDSCIARYIIVEAEGIAIINDWQFVASLEHTAHGNIINKVIEVEVPERYYTTDAVCEHCKSRRARKNTYIVRNIKTDEFKQVGKSCLRDFTGGMDVEFAAQMAQFITEAEEATHFGGYTHQEFYYETMDFLLYAVETISKYGYAPTSEVNSTINKVREIIKYTTGNYNRNNSYESRRAREIEAELEKKGFNHDTEENRNTAESAIAWAMKQDAEKSNYIHNLQVVVQDNLCKYKNSGILASLIPTYFKAVEREMKMMEQKAEEAKSEWQGEIGKRITVLIKEWRCVASWDTQWGSTGIYKMVDEQGNIYTWKTSNGIYCDENIDEVEVKGTVKAHNEFREAKQTELTRCKVKYIIRKSENAEKRAERFRRYIGEACEIR